MAVNYGVRLTKVSNINRELANIYKELKEDKIDNNKARALVYTLSILITGIEKGVLENKCKELMAICKENGLL